MAAPRAWDAAGRPLPAPRVVDASGREVRLAAPPVGKGGEGTVYRLRADAALLAKIYHQPTAARARKVAALVELASPSLTAVSSWPVAALLPEPGAPAIGFLMRAAPGRQMHELYSPKSRLTAFPGVNWRFLLHAAANLARAVATVHASGAVVGDLNHANCYVTDQATVHLIDCDSFQIALRGELFRCAVATDLFTPPELQGVRLDEVTRTPDHDAFGLAVLIFLLLANGRHPFAGRYRGAGDMPIPRAIAEHRFAYGAGARGLLMEAPPHALALRALSPAVGALFEESFAGGGNGGAAAGGPGRRPAASRWIAALDELAAHLEMCRVSSAHLYFDRLAACPWCEIEGAVGVLLFHVPVRAAPGQDPDLHLVWAQIEATPRPAAAVLPREPSMWPGKASAAVRRFVGFWLAGMIAVVAALVALAVVTWPAGFTIALVGARVVYGVFNNTRQRKLEELAWIRDLKRNRWASLAAQLAGGDEEFDRAKGDLAAARASHAGLAAERQHELARLRDQARERQLHWYLDRYDLPTARITGIGEAKLAVLRSYGVETAADVEAGALLQVPGIGPALAGRLVEWRQSLLPGFRFDAARSLDDGDVRALDQRLDLKRRRLAATLQEGPAALLHLKRQIDLRRTALHADLDHAARELAQALRDLNTVAMDGGARALGATYVAPRRPPAPRPPARRPPAARPASGRPPARSGRRRP